MQFATCFKHRLIQLPDFWGGHKGQVGMDFVVPANRMTTREQGKIPSAA
jgi:hypothetical protein